MNSPTLSANPPTVVLGLVDAPGPATVPITGLETLLFGLSLATVLPPAVLLPPPDVGLPTIHPTRRPILSAAEVGAVVGRPTQEVGRGRIALHDVDRRLHGLVVALDTFLLTDESAALICVGLVSPVRPASEADGVTSASLWNLAREVLPRFALVSEHPVAFGRDALVVCHAGMTTQLIWLTGDDLATVSVTRLDGDDEWRTEIAYSIARLLALRLESRAP